MLLKDKVAIITGASRGIGAATALRYAKEGACVVVNFAHNQDAADAIVEQIKLDGGRAVAICADVADAKTVTAMVKQTAKDFGGRIDILVNNAFPGFLGGTIGEAKWQDLAYGLYLYEKRVMGVHQIGGVHRKKYPAARFMIGVPMPLIGCCL
jgi:NAD(P)-dependent dehydrogenase (short-subunit alcohol dehydrogenase family)